jgi:hypothetical protein
MPTFDLSSKIVTEEQNAWVVHAGRARKHFAGFVAEDAVFLETPFLKIDRTIVQSKNLLRQAVRRSRAFEKHFGTTGSEQPSELLSDYPSDPFDDSRLTSLTGSVSSLFGKAKVGDIVMVPGRDDVSGLLQSSIRFGEIASDFKPEDIMRVTNTGLIQVPYRRIKWLNTVPRRKIPFYLERKIGKPPAVRKIEIEKETEEILKYSYPSYIFSGNSSSLIRGDKYDGPDFLLLNKCGELISTLIAAHAFFGKPENRVVPKIHSIVDVDEFTNRYFPDARIENVEVGFASPGSWRIMGATVTLGAFVALGVAIFSSDLTAQQLATDLSVTNSVSPSDGSSENLRESMGLFLKSLEPTQFEKLSKTGRKGKEKIGLSSPVKIKP